MRYLISGFILSINGDGVDKICVMRPLTRFRTQ